MINLNNVIERINPSDIDNYDWEIIVNDGIIDNEGIKIKEAAFFDAKNNQYFDTNLENPVTIKDEQFIIKNKDTAVRYDKLTINDEIYGFKTEKKAVFKFSTPSKYYDKRYYNIYVLDSEYGGKLADLEKDYEPSICTNDGTGELEIDKGKYIYCIAKNKSMWDAIIYKNFAKLTIQMKNN
jgi:hypothetical protein